MRRWPTPPSRSRDQKKRYEGWYHITLGEKSVILAVGQGSTHLKDAEANLDLMVVDLTMIEEGEDKAGLDPALSKISGKFGFVFKIMLSLLQNLLEFVIVSKKYPADGETTMIKFSFHKSLYSRAALLKAAYHFTDRFYVRLDADDTSYFVEMTAKDGVDDTSAQGEFANEILAQSAREEILRQTSNIRELILGRAFGSTIMDADAEEAVDPPGAEEADEIFKDWYKV